MQNIGDDKQHNDSDIAINGSLQTVFDLDHTLQSTASFWTSYKTEGFLLKKVHQMDLL